MESLVSRQQDSIPLAVLLGSDPTELHDEELDMAVGGLERAWTPRPEDARPREDHPDRS